MQVYINGQRSRDVTKVCRKTRPMLLFDADKWNYMPSSNVSVKSRDWKKKSMIKLCSVLKNQPIIRKRND